jgi:hypothetical protein
MFYFVGSFVIPTKIKHIDKNLIETRLSASCLEFEFVRSCHTLLYVKRTTSPMKGKKIYNVNAYARLKMTSNVRHAKKKKNGGRYRLSVTVITKTNWTNDGSLCARSVQGYESVRHGCLLGEEVTRRARWILRFIPKQNGQVMCSSRWITVLCVSVQS